MPQFLVYARVLKNEESAAFMINEVAYWGNEKEKAKLHEGTEKPLKFFYV